MFNAVEIGCWCVGQLSSIGTDTGLSTLVRHTNRIENELLIIDIPSIITEHNKVRGRRILCEFIRIVQCRGCIVRGSNCNGDGSYILKISITEDIGEGFNPHEVSSRRVRDGGAIPCNYDSATAIWRADRTDHQGFINVWRDFVVLQDIQGVISRILLDTEGIIHCGGCVINVCHINTDVSVLLHSCVICHSISEINQSGIIGAGTERENTTIHGNGTAFGGLTSRDQGQRLTSYVDHIVAEHV